MAHDLLQQNPLPSRDEFHSEEQVFDNQRAKLNDQFYLRKYKLEQFKNCRTTDINKEEIYLSDLDRQQDWNMLIDQYIKILTDPKKKFENFELDLAYQNAKLRLKYLVNSEFVTVHESKSDDNLILAEWEKMNQIFSVTFLNQKFYPAFQFKDNKPIEIIQKILAELPKEMSSWQIAFWFESSNGWISGKNPKDCLNLVEQLVKAAQQENLAHRF